MDLVRIRRPLRGAGSRDAPVCQRPRQQRWNGTHRRSGTARRRHSPHARIPRDPAATMGALHAGQKLLESYPQNPLAGVAPGDSVCGQAAARLPPPRALAPRCAGATPGATQRDTDSELILRCPLLPLDHCIAYTGAVGAIMAISA